MVTVYVHPPAGTPEEQVELPPGEAVLIGRDPDPAALDPGLGAPAVVRRVAVASPLVSSNHALLWCDGQDIRTCDLNSKNGTYLRIERGGAASLHRAGEAHLYLTSPKPQSSGAAPRDVAVADTDAALFAQRLKDAVVEWLARRGLHPLLDVLRGEPGGSAADGPGPGQGVDDSRFTIPLVEGLTLCIVDPDIGQTQIRWDGIKAEIFPYAYEQIARWRACRVAHPGGALAFRAPAAERALRQVLDAARQRQPLVLYGESGTGKTALAAIYADREAGRPGRGAAARREGPPFVTVHCAHLDSPLAHATLFGALKGSYTSSERAQAGAVKLADGGVLLLDDVDALPLETQAKLLRFLDDGEYEPLGHGQREPLWADVRVVASSNADLRAAVRQRHFREDLYWRLHMGAVVQVPPLRERAEDIEQLLRGVRHQIEDAAAAFLIQRYPWRGNFRECLRFCARARVEPPGQPPLDRRRCEEILAEAALDQEEPAAGPVSEDGGGAFNRALRQAVAWWRESEGTDPDRFDELNRFCEVYLKSAFVAHALGLADAPQRPDSFDRERRLQLGCDLTTLKRKVDDYLALRQGVHGERREDAAG